MAKRGRKPKKQCKSCSHWTPDAGTDYGECDLTPRGVIKVKESYCCTDWKRNG